MKQATLGSPPDIARRRPFVWVTWLTKVLAGEDHCVYRPWYQAHYQIPKEESPERQAFFDAANKKHDAIQDAREAELKADGWLVKREEQGEFKLRGKTGDLAGKPDLVGLRGDDVLISEIKSGKQRESDAWQVLIYWFALQLSWLKGTDSKIQGEVKYRNKTRPVTWFSPESRKQITDLLGIVTGDAEPAKAPSKWGCIYCPILGCDERFQETAESDATGAF